jgi:hypothetical protein
LHSGQSSSGSSSWKMWTLSRFPQCTPF